MNEAQRLWAIHHEHIEPGEIGTPAMFYEDFLKAIDDYNPWITDREPTREDGDAFECVEFWDGVATRTEKLYFKPEGRPWRKILKPKI